MNNTDYTKFRRQEPEVVSEEVVEDRFAVVEEETVEPEVAVAEPEVVETMVGVVSGCAKLNVRKLPSPSSEIMCELVDGSKVEIDKESSTEAYYKICNSAGVEGYCIKKFISVE